MMLPEWRTVGEYRECEHGFHHPPWPHSCDGCYGCDVPPEYRRETEFKEARVSGTDPTTEAV